METTPKLKQKNIALKTLMSVALWSFKGQARAVIRASGAASVAFVKGCINSLAVRASRVGRAGRGFRAGAGGGGVGIGVY